MASGNQEAGERILEGRHVIALLFLMMLLSGVFFTLGYVMGFNRYDGQVQAASNHIPNAPLTISSDAKRNASSAHSGTGSDTTSPPNSDWEFYRAEKKKPDDHYLKVPPPKRTVNPKTTPAAVPNEKSATSPPPLSNRSYHLQVAAFAKESEALALANNLQKKRFPAFVLSPQGDKFHSVQVGPYSNQKAAEIARKGLKKVGFKAIVKRS